jgi:hypothetical protein
LINQKEDFVRKGLGKEGKWKEENEEKKVLIPPFWGNNLTLK